MTDCTSQARSLIAQIKKSKQKSQQVYRQFMLEQSQQATLQSVNTSIEHKKDLRSNSHEKQEIQHIQISKQVLQHKKEEKKEEKEEEAELEETQCKKALFGSLNLDSIEELPNEYQDESKQESKVSKRNASQSSMNLKELQQTQKKEDVSNLTLEDSEDDKRVVAQHEFLVDLKILREKKQRVLEHIRNIDQQLSEYQEYQTEISQQQIEDLLEQQQQEKLINQKSFLQKSQIQRKSSKVSKQPSEDRQTLLHKIQKDVGKTIKRRQKGLSSQKRDKWDRLYMQSNLFDQKKELVSKIFKIESTRKQMQECTFAPKINKSYKQSGGVQTISIDLKKRQK